MLQLEQQIQQSVSPQVELEAHGMTKLRLERSFAFFEQFFEQLDI